VRPALGVTAGRGAAPLQVGAALLRHFGGQAANLVLAAQRSAVALVQLVAQHLPGFRDHAVYRGRQVRPRPWPALPALNCGARGAAPPQQIPARLRCTRRCQRLQHLPAPPPPAPPRPCLLQVFLYKRAQIFVGDVFGAFNGQGLGQFDDIDKLTMFADYRCARARLPAPWLPAWNSCPPASSQPACMHNPTQRQRLTGPCPAARRVPVVLRVMGVLQYSAELEEQVGAGACCLRPSTLPCSSRAAGPWVGQIKGELEG
jgi:hypothetical protein